MVLSSHNNPPLQILLPFQRGGILGKMNTLLKSQGPKCQSLFFLSWCVLCLVLNHSRACRFPWLALPQCLSGPARFQKWESTKPSLQTLLEMKHLTYTAHGPHSDVLLFLNNSLQIALFLPLCCKIMVMFSKVF